jgi:hypothetical protein
MKTLEEVDNFGSIDADNDPLLFSCFEDHEAYRHVRDLSRFLVIGRKGSGKTAIFKQMLALKEHNTFCFGHTFADYPWHHHQLQAQIGVPEFDRYTQSWKYLSLLSLAKLILNQDQGLPYDEESMNLMASVERFIIDSYGSRDPDVTQFFTPSKALKLKPHFELDWKILKAGISPEYLPVKELPTIVQDVTRTLSRSLIRCLHPEHTYFICFDQLDLGLDLETNDYKNRLIGLLLAARDLNLAARPDGKSLLIVVFLRDDIYDALQFEDKNKLTENSVSRIEWDTASTVHTLKSLMEKRFDVLLASNDQEHVAWEDVVDETAEMSGHQTKYRHLIDRTYLRPRDMIRICNATLQQYKQRRVKTPDSQQKIVNADVINARGDYSDYLLRELDDEIHKHVPDYKMYIALLRSLGIQSFEREKFVEMCKAKPEFTAGSAEGDILAALYRFSIIGFYRAGGKGLGGAEWVFRYREPGTAFDVNASKFRVHTGLLDVLGLKKFTWGSGGDEVPIPEEGGGTAT